MTEDMSFKIEILEVKDGKIHVIFNAFGDVKDFDRAVFTAARLLIRRYGLDMGRILKTAQEVKP